MKEILEAGFFPHILVPERQECGTFGDQVGNDRG
jgi:hypothetical protein